MTQGRTYKLDELAAEAEVSPRTVRYYVQRGLLPAPEFRGRDTAYTEDHLQRLRAIRRMQEQYLPLDAIQAELAQRPVAELAEPPAPRPRPAPRGEVVVRHALAPGVELLVAERLALSDAAVAELAATLDRHLKGRRT